MKPLAIPATATTPHVLLDAANGTFEITGRSVADTLSTVYLPVLQWLAAYAKEPNTSTPFVFKLEYFNTASSKALLDTVTALSHIKNANVLWYYPEHDEDMKEAGEEFFELVNIPFEFKTY